jgi:thiamine biosynthesis lipoprotein
VRADAVMGTIVTIHVVRTGTEAAIDRAFGWFHEIEQRCTRFDETSELMQLTAHTGVPMAASAILFEAVQFALRVAEASGGAFDPTVGYSMQERGFNREHRSGEIIRTVINAAPDVTYRDVGLDPERKTITLQRPLLLDLGAVAKGLAIDAAARELLPFEDFAIDAGGDVYLGGHNPKGEPWTVGIRHPRHDNALIETLQVSNKAVCTSGDYEHPNHILNPHTREPATAAASATVIAPTALLADALATAAFVLGPEAGIRLLDQMDVQGIIFTPSLERFQTANLRHAA